MAVPSCGHVEFRHIVPTVLGLCQGLGSPADELQEPVAQERINASPQDHLLRLHGKRHRRFSTKKKIIEQNKIREKWMIISLVG